MTEPVTYMLEGGVARITVDDGKVNALSSALQAAIWHALDRAAGDGAAAVVLAGRDGVFSGGFDLAVFRAGDAAAAAEMVGGGFRLAERLLSLPVPVVVACTGHAIAAGLFLVLSADHRVGAGGPFRLVANEVAIGLTMPRAAVALLRQRLTPAAFNSAVTMATTFDPEAAVRVGMLDELVAPEAVVARAVEVAAAATALDPAPPRESQLRARDLALRELREAMAADAADFPR